MVLHLSLEAGNFILFHFLSLGWGEFDTDVTFRTESTLTLQPLVAVFPAGHTDSLSVNREPIGYVWNSFCLGDRKQHPDPRQPLLMLMKSYSCFVNSHRQAILGLTKVKHQSKTSQLPICKAEKMAKIDLLKTSKPQTYKWLPSH